MPQHVHTTPQESLETEIQEALDWLDDNAGADADDYAAKQKEVEALANPVMKHLYESSAGGGGGGGDGDDAFDDEL
jgi:heat shock 70kDa protein 1/2/6/8